MRIAIVMILIDIYLNFPYFVVIRIIYLWLSFVSLMALRILHI